MEGFDESDLRCPFDSILPATLDAAALDDRTPPAPFDLVNGRPSSIGFPPPQPTTRAWRVATIAALAALSIFAAAAPRIRLAAPSAPAQRPHRSMTPAQAATWAAAPFTVEVPVESSSEPDRSVARETPLPAVVPPPLPHFDIEAVSVALAEAKSSLSTCEQGDHGSLPMSARAAVTFSPKGNVTAVDIDPASDVESFPHCVVDRLRAVRVAAFVGPSVTVRTTVSFFPAGSKP